MQTSHSAAASLAALKDTGIEVGLDDFRTGFSALSYPRAFLLDFIKIDRSFVDGIAIEPRSLSIVAAMIDLAHALGLEVVAEGLGPPPSSSCSDAFAATAPRASCSRRPCHPPRSRTCPAP